MADLVSVVVDEGLGNAGYLVDLGDDRALVVDPSVDVRALRAEAHRRGLRIGYVAETHLHADFLSGACQLAATEGASILASRAGGRTFEHVGMGDGDEVDLGGLRLRALSTPGHTDEHVAFLLLDGSAPLGVFSGGTLLVDGVARTDLVDPRRTEQLARHQYQAVQRLLELPDETALWPTHGAGSFCAAAPGADRTSTIGRERATGQLARAPNEESFVRGLLDALGAFPPYFLRLAEQNRRGPHVADPPLPQVDVAQVEALRAEGAVVVDARSMTTFAAAHIPGSLSIELRPVFATWLGWLVPPDRPVVIVRDGEQDAADIWWQAAKVGVQLTGELRGGVDAWMEAGRHVRSTALKQPADVAAGELVDVRQATEFTSGHVPGATNVELGALRDGLPGRPVVLMCGHGERAMTGASLLEAAGRGDDAVLIGGPSDWTQAHDLDVAIGP